MRILAPIAAAALLAVLAGCGAPVTAPSLEVRPVERQSIDLPAETSEPAVAVEPALRQQLAALVATAEDGDRRFDATRAVAERAVAAAAGASQGSEAWTAAQQALSALDAAQGPVRDAAGTVEGLRLDPAHAGSGDRAAVDVAATRIAALADAEARIVAALSARLR